MVASVSVIWIVREGDVSLPAVQLISFWRLHKVLVFSHTKGTKGPPGKQSAQDEKKQYFFLCEVCFLTMGWEEVISHAKLHQAIDPAASAQPMNNPG
ncbi:unnamed protein product [Allacma fusca]|uniref:Uncharacterized protein n=1 Tax=Allacma fusca TaxID=39272 RepID=A0A8J2JVL3_9HEXA|nr:unnamed protein product [Allacma fusca]